MEEMTSEIDKTEKTGTRDKHKAEPNRPKQQDSRQDRQRETGRHTVTQSMGTQTNYTIRKGEEEGVWGSWRKGEGGGGYKWG